MPANVSNSKYYFFVFLVAGIVSAAFPSAVVAQGVGVEEVAKTLRKAVEFYRDRVSTEGGYLWKYAADLSLREGENPVDDRTVWVQPPGTPTVGLAFLRAYRVTGDRYYLDAAAEAGRCLVRGQLESGGWIYPIHFDPAKRKDFRYRTNASGHAAKARNVSTLDDNTTQSALVFLMELDEALAFKDAAIHEAALYGLRKLIEAQYPNGAFPQVFRDDKRDPSKYPILTASFPPQGTEPTHEKEYWNFYTLNDNLALDVNRVFFVAAEVYENSARDGKYAAAAKRLGDFLIAAQLPQPQPAWAQQYDFNMRPCWARKFEPAAVSGGESQGVINALIELYRFTGDKKYLGPIPAAVAWLERSRLPDGKVARFYEMRTNRPLYMTKDYALTYSDADVPTHYAFSVNLASWPADLQKDGPQAQALQERYRNRALPKVDERQVEEVCRSLDARGAWVTEDILKSAPGKKAAQIIDSQVFVRNLDVLLAFLKEHTPR